MNPNFDRKFKEKKSIKEINEARKRRLRNLNWKLSINLIRYYWRYNTEKYKRFIDYFKRKFKLNYVK